jgi:hypothetical protein
MTFEIRSLPGAAARSSLRVSTAVLLVGLVSGPAPASAEDIVLKWNDVAARTAVVTSPFNQARVMAIVQLSVFEAVNAITGGYEPYLDPAPTAVAGASVDAAVIRPRRHSSWSSEGCRHGGRPGCGERDDRPPRD